MTTLEFTYKIDSLTQALTPFALKLTRNKDDANDLIQETMLKAYSNRDKFKRGTNLKAWMYTIMRNTFISNFHRLVRRKTFIDTTENHYYLNTLEIATRNHAYSNFVVEDIHAALESLDENYRAAFTMYFTGHKYKEIAEKLSLPLGTVKNRIHIARKLLKQQLRQYVTH